MLYGEAARLVSYIRADEAPHVAYLKTVLSEMRDRTFVGESGRHYAGSDVVGELWDRAKAESLGGRRQQNLALTLREGLGLAAAGTVAGLAGAALTARLLQDQLYGVNPRDPVTYGAALTLVLISAVLACWTPARRASAESAADATRTG